MNDQRLILHPHGLYVFCDDTGHEHLAGQNFYGIGGCAVLGRDYVRLISEPWSEVRLLIEGDRRAPLHASKFGRGATPRQLDVVSRFFRERPFMRVGAAGASTTVIVPKGLPLMRVVLEVLKQRIVNVAQHCHFESVTVVFENNPRANRYVQAYFADVQFRIGTREVPTECCFMPKSANECALEVADFVANAVGGHARRNLVQERDGFRMDFKAVFHSVDERLANYLGVLYVVPREPAGPTPPLTALGLSRGR